MKILIFILSLLPLSPVFAAETGCEKDMLPPSMRAYRLFWEEAIETSLTRKEPLSGIEYEALMDVNSGLKVKVKYKNGEVKISDKGEYSYREIKEAINSSPIVEEEILPDQKKYLKQNVFEPAEKILGMNHSLSLIQERALKWATVHIIPNHGTYVRMTQLAHDNGVTFDELWSNNLVARAIHSRKMLGDVFAPEEISPLFTGLVGPMVRAGFDARLSQETSKRN